MASIRVIMGNSLCGGRNICPKSGSKLDQKLEVCEPEIILPMQFNQGRVDLSGGKTKVYRRFDTVNCMDVVIKEVPLHLLRAEQKEKLRKEVEILKSLKHPNIVRFYDSREENNTIFIYMECMTGGSLADQLKGFKGSAIFEPAAGRFLGMILKGLKYLHNREIIHRDLKCANVLYCDDASSICKLSDFGSAIRIHELSYSNVGTTGFTAPEVA